MFSKKLQTIGIIVGAVLVITLIVGVSNGLDLWNILSLLLLMGILTLAVASVMLSRPIERIRVGNRLVAPLVLLVIYLAIEGLIVVRWMKWGRYETYGAPTQGVITHLDTRNSMVYYSYLVNASSGDQSTFNGQASVGSAIFQELKVGSRIDIRYLTSNPNSSEVDTNLENPWPFAACCSCWTLLHLVWVAGVIWTGK
jgi:hypothetical protein